MTKLIEQSPFSPCCFPRAEKSCLGNGDILKVNLWGLKGAAGPAAGEGQG